MDLSLDKLRELLEDFLADTDGRIIGRVGEGDSVEIRGLSLS